MAPSSTLPLDVRRWPFIPTEIELVLESSPRDEAGESLRREYVVVVVVVVVVVEEEVVVWDELEMLLDVGCCCCCETRTGMTNHPGGPFFLFIIILLFQFFFLSLVARGPVVVEEWVSCFECGVATAAVATRRVERSWRVCMDD